MTRKTYAEALIDALVERAGEDENFAMIGRGILGRVGHRPFFLLWQYPLVTRNARNAAISGA